MARFRYRMQNILELKEKLEEQAKMRYAEQRHILNEAEAKERELIERKERYIEKGIELRLNILNIRDIHENEQDVKAIKIMIEEQEKVVKRESAELERRRKGLEDIMKERKAQEKLKEHAFERFMQEENAAESKAVDELTSYIYGNREK